MEINLKRRKAGKIRSTNTSGYKGVHWHRKAGKWQATITSRGKIHYLGLHNTPEDAHAAYLKACKRLHGEFSPTKTVRDLLDEKRAA